MPAETLYWHDYETFGVDPRVDRPCQFAGVRTDVELNEVSEPLVAYARPSEDYLPQPQACLITGITPQRALKRGVPEPEFAALIEEQLALGGTCGVGYNSIRFDDEVTRRLLYRNFYDPYAREYSDGNSRWDLIDVVRLTYALRPAGIEWPLREDGAPSFRLEHLAEANGLNQGSAHDALADVHATIALARLVRARQRRLFDYCYTHRQRDRCAAMLDFGNLKPVLHVSARYPAARGCLAIVLPLCPHPINRWAVISYDLSVDPAPLLELSASEIEDRVFTPKADLPEGVERIPLKSISAAHAPVLAPLNTLRGIDLERIGLDLDRCLGHRDRIAAADGVAAKVRQVYSRAPPPAPTDPELDLYGEFPSPKDRELIARVRTTPPAELRQLEPGFEQAKYAELLFRYRARHHPDTLDPTERERWHAFRRERLLGGEPSACAQTLAAIAELRAEHAGAPDKLAILDQLEAYARDLTRDLQPPGRTS